MSLTGFNRLRRMQQEEAMKPENIENNDAVKEQIIAKFAQPIEEKTEEVQETTTRRRRRN